MSNFTTILTHGRKLQGAVKELSASELESVVQKLNAIITSKKEKEAESLLLKQAKNAKLADILKQMQDAGIAVSDLQTDEVKKVKKPQQKRPVKYKLTDESGDIHSWTGIGRMPKVYAQAIAAGKKLSDFSI